MCMFDLGHILYRYAGMHFAVYATASTAAVLTDETSVKGCNNIPILRSVRP